MDHSLNACRRVILQTAVLLLGGLLIAGCMDSGGPLLSPEGARGALGGTEELEGITATSSPQCPWGYTGTAPDCIPSGGWVPSGSSPGMGFTGSDGSTDTSSGSLPGDENGDGDTMDEGLAAFAVCVAAKMGPSGWLSVLATGISAWQLYEAREQVRATYGAWELYHSGSSSNPDWNLATENLFWANFQNAQSAETALWATTAAAAISTTYEVGRSIVACAPTLAIPEP